MDFDVTTAENGREAIDLCKKEDFDLILMDIRMPVINGVEATKEIKKFKNITIIAFTTFSATDIQKIYDYSGFNGFLQKPVNKQTFKDFFEKTTVFSP